MAPSTNNLFGAIIGTYVDGNGGVRAPDGANTTLDAPDGVGSTLASANNDVGEITGWYQDANGDAHGFLRR